MNKKVYVILGVIILLAAVVSINSFKNTAVKNQNDAENRESFTIDCGSGCAMTFDEVFRKTNKNSVEIKYKVIQYNNEKIEDEYFETYIFESDENRNLTSIHLNKDKENILTDTNSLLREKFLEIGLKIYPKSIAKKVNSEKQAFVSEDKPYQLIKVPFDLKEYIDHLPKQIENGYHPSSVTEKYLVSIGYEGESYECFFIKNNINATELLVSVSRADSEYFLLLKANQNEFTSYEEIGSIGGEEAKYFRIDENYNVVSY